MGLENFKYGKSFPTPTFSDLVLGQKDVLLSVLQAISSEAAYGSVTYLRSVNGQVHVSFVKSPICKLTISHLELCAAQY